MSEEKAKTVYAVEYAKSGRAKCKGPKSCEQQHPDRTIGQGELRLGTTFERADGRPSTQWRHWTCTTAAILHNIGSIDNLQGVGDLKEEDQARVKEALEKGEVPGAVASSRGGKKVAAEPAGEKKKRVRSKKAAKEEEPAEEEGEEEPEGKEGEEEAEEEEEEEEKPKKKRAPAKKKAPAEPKAKKPAASKKSKPAPEPEPEPDDDEDEEDDAGEEEE